MATDLHEAERKIHEEQNGKESFAVPEYHEEDLEEISLDVNPYSYSRNFLIDFKELFAKEVDSEALPELIKQVAYPMTHDTKKEEKLSQILRLFKAILIRYVLSNKQQALFNEIQGGDLPEEEGDEQGDNANQAIEYVLMQLESISTLLDSLKKNSVDMFENLSDSEILALVNVFFFNSFVGEIIQSASYMHKNPEFIPGELNKKFKDVAVHATIKYIEEAILILRNALKYVFNKYFVVSQAGKKADLLVENDKEITQAEEIDAFFLEYLEKILLDKNKKNEKKLTADRQDLIIMLRQNLLKFPVSENVGDVNLNLGGAKQNFQQTLDYGPKNPLSARETVEIISLNLGTHTIRWVAFTKSSIGAEMIENAPILNAITFSGTVVTLTLQYSRLKRGYDITGRHILPLEEICVSIAAAMASTYALIHIKEKKIIVTLFHSLLRAGLINVFLMNFCIQLAIKRYPETAGNMPVDFFFRHVALLPIVASSFSVGWDVCPLIISEMQKKCKTLSCHMPEQLIKASEYITVSVDLLLDALYKGGTFWLLINAYSPKTARNITFQSVLGGASLLSALLQYKFDAVKKFFKVGLTTTAVIFFLKQFIESDRTAGFNRNESLWLKLITDSVFAVILLQSLWIFRKAWQQRFKDYLNPDMVRPHIIARRRDTKGSSAAGSVALPSMQLPVGDYHLLAEAVETGQLGAAREHYNRAAAPSRVAALLEEEAGLPPGQQKSVLPQYNNAKEIARDQARQADEEALDRKSLCATFCQNLCQWFQCNTG